MAAIMGLDRWRTPGDVQAEKDGILIGEDAENESMAIGTAMEDAIAKLFEARTGIGCAKPTGPVKCKNSSAIRANVDRFAVIDGVKTVIPVECKAWNMDDGWGGDGTSEVPVSVLVQVQTQLACTTAEYGYVARISGRFGWKFEVYKILANKEMQAAIVKFCDDWWLRHITNGDVLPVEDRPSNDTFQKMVTKPGKVAHIEKPLYKAVMESRVAIDKAEEILSKIMSEFKYVIGDAEVVAVDGNVVATYRRNADTLRLDGGKLKLEQPAIWSKYAEEQKGARVLRFTKSS